MAYDPVKAHEYYVNYRKKGLKKGRKKGTGKSRTTGLLGVSAAGLNSDGAVEAAVIKDRLKKEMNEKLKGAKTEEEKIAIRKAYAKKANEEIAKLRSDPKFARAKATKTPSTKSKSSGSNRSLGSGSSRSGSSRSSGESQSSRPSRSSTKSTSQVSTPNTPITVSPQVIAAINNVKSIIAGAQSKIANLSESERADLKAQLQGLITRLQQYISSQKR